MSNIFSKVTCHGLYSENEVPCPTDSNKYFTLSNSEGRWDMVSQYVFCEYSTEEKDDESLYLGYKKKISTFKYFSEENELYTLEYLFPGMMALA